MKSTLATSFSLSLLGLAASRPASSETTVRTLPYNWGFEITALEGPGCPDFGAPPDGPDRTTRLTYGQNTVDGTEVYYWFIAYPALRVELGKTNSVWCETELKYREYGSTHEEASDYRLRLHKNGTKAIATYDLDTGAKATFSFTYLDADTTDSLTLNGPLASGQYQKEHNLVGPETPPSEVATCGAATIKFRTEITVEGSGKKGVVDSEHLTDKDGHVQYYGTQLGFSFDFEECNA